MALVVNDTFTGTSGTAITSHSGETGATNNIFSLTGTVLNAADGTVEFLPSATDVDYVGDYYFDVQFLDARGLKNTAGKKKLTFYQDITKA